MGRLLSFGWTLVALGLLLSALLIVLALLLRRRKPMSSPGGQAAPAEDPAAPAAAAAPETVVDFTRLGGERLESAFRRGLRRLREYASRRAEGDPIPWFLLLGEEASGKSRLFEGSGLELPVGPPDDAEAHGCAWWLFAGGAVLEVAGGHLLRGDGGAAPEHGWRRLLALLERYRPERPLDGVVLALPGAELFGPPERAAERRALAEQKAALLAARLRQLQKKLGLRFPVYVLVTGCERVPGFDGFFDPLPARAAGEIFGWSNPYAVESAYHDAWVEEAFASLRRDLYQAQFEVFAEGRDLADPDGIFLFPDELETLRGPLAVYLDRLFKPSAYHEPIFLRGVYFTAWDVGAPPAASPEADLDLWLRLGVRGESGGGRRVAPARGPSQVAVRSLFVKDLFERKVFPERALAVPASATLLARNRAVRAAQIGLAAAALLLGLGLWREDVRLRRSEGILLRFLEEARRDLRDAGQPNAETARIEERTFRLLAGMAAIDTSWFGSPFLPSSWVSRVNGDLRRAIVRVYDQVILQALAGELQQRGDALASGAPPAASLDGAALPLDQTPEFVALRSWVRDVARFDRAAARFNGLKETKDLQDLSAVVAYLFGRPLPKAFFEHDELYRTALADVSARPLDAAALAPGVRSQARARLRVLWQVLYRDNRLIRGLDALAEELASAGQADGSEVERLRRILGLAREVELALADPELARRAAPAFDPGPPFAGVLKTLRGTPLLGPALAEEARRGGAVAHQGCRETLAAYDSPFTGPLLELPTAARPRLAENVGMLVTAVRDLLDRGFMAGGEARQFLAALPPGTRLQWDVRLLEAAAAAYEPYESFVTDGLQAFPPDLREPLREVAGRRLAAQLSGLVARAQDFVPAPEPATLGQLELEVRAEVEELAAAAKPVARLVEVFARLDLPAHEQGLSELAAAQALATLARLDRLLGAEDLYAPRQGSFAWWDGRKSLAVRAFEVDDPAQLPVYLDRQRERIAFLAREYAEPVLATLGKSGRRLPQKERARIDRWEGILGELYRYDGKKPGNSVALLESLVLGDLQDAELTSCPRLAAGSGAARGLRRQQAGADYFLAAADRLRRSLTERCRSLVNDEAATGYRRLERLFNRRLAGRFPFSSSPPGRLDAEADPEAVRDLFALYDRHAALLAAVAAEEEGGILGPEHRRFLDALTKVRAFLAGFLDAPERPRVPVFDVEVDFRSNRERELAGNEVLTWQLAIGDRRVSQRDAERRARWALGMPVRVALLWAKDSPRVPLDPEGEETPDRAALYEYTGRWSLLALLREQAGMAEDFDGFADPRPHTLRFAVATRDLLTGAAGNTRAYVRVYVKSPDQKEELRMPEFPARAPVLGAVPVPEAEIVEAADEP